MHHTYVRSTVWGGDRIRQQVPPHINPASGTGLIADRRAQRAAHGAQQTVLDIIGIGPPAVRVIEQTRRRYPGHPGILVQTVDAVAHRHRNGRCVQIGRVADAKARHLVRRRIGKVQRHIVCRAGQVGTDEELILLIIYFTKILSQAHQRSPDH